MAFTYHRTVRFQDTDAAGVVYFANIMNICHEAYEASLAQAGIKLREFFHSQGIVAVPIVHANVDFHQPLFCGDTLRVQLLPSPINDCVFEVAYQVFSVSDQPAASAKTRHICIEPRSRAKRPLPNELVKWLKLMRDEVTNDASA
jgi:1,4-dihydroxy-2-naphthoyl-CoA hydrolase